MTGARHAMVSGKSCMRLTFVLCSNIPKFLAPDIPLFEAILRDLFPGVTVPSVDYGTVQVIVKKTAT